MVDDLGIRFRYDRLRFAPFEAFPLPTILKLLITYREKYYVVRCVKIENASTFQYSHLQCSFTSARSKENDIKIWLDIFGIMLTVHRDRWYNKTSEKPFLEFYSDYFLYMFRIAKLFIFRRQFYCTYSLW